MAPSLGGLAARTGAGRPCHAAAGPISRFRRPHRRAASVVSRPLGAADAVGQGLVVIVRVAGAMLPAYLPLAVKLTCIAWALGPNVALCPLCVVPHSRYESAQRRATTLRRDWDPDLTLHCEALVREEIGWIRPLSGADSPPTVWPLWASIPGLH